MNIQETNNVEWKLVDPRYSKQLKIMVCFPYLALSLALAFISFIVIKEETNPPIFIFSSLAVLLAITFLWFFFYWTKKKAQRTRYLVADKDINLQRGVLFWHHVSVSFNRIQHLEVNQGPIERLFSLGTLSVFTAGTMGSDLKISGLPHETAKDIKSHLLNEINNEAPMEEEA